MEDKSLIRRLVDLENELDATRSELERARVAPPARATAADADIAEKGGRSSDVAPRQATSLPALSTWSGAINLVLWLNLAVLGGVSSYLGIPVPAWACAACGLVGSLLALLLLARVFLSNLKKSVAELLGIEKETPQQGKIRCYRCRDIFDVPRGARTAVCPYCNTPNEAEPSH